MSNQPATCSLPYAQALINDLEALKATDKQRYDLAQEVERLTKENAALVAWGQRIYAYYLDHMQSWDLALMLEDAPECVKAASDGSTS